MKWRVTPKPVPNYLDWHPTYAWWPVQVGDYKYWLCWMSRKAEWDQPITDRNVVNGIIHTSGCNKWSYLPAVYYP